MIRVPASMPRIVEIMLTAMISPMKILMTWGLLNPIALKVPISITFNSSHIHQIEDQYADNDH